MKVVVVLKNAAVAAFDDGSFFVCPDGRLVIEGVAADHCTYEQGSFAPDVWSHVVYDHGKAQWTTPASGNRPSMSDVVYLDKNLSAPA